MGSKLIRICLYVGICVSVISTAGYFSHGFWLSEDQPETNNLITYEIELGGEKFSATQFESSPIKIDVWWQKIDYKIFSRVISNDPVRVALTLFNNGERSERCRFHKVGYPSGTCQVT